VVLCVALVGLVLPRGASAYVYWANEGSGSVGRVGLDGIAPNQGFLPGLSSPEGVAVSGSFIYWANQGTNSIGRVDLDGSDRLPNFIVGAKKPFGVAVDGSHVYWTNSENSTVGRANLDGTQVNQGLVSGLSGPEGLAVDGAHIYWANFSVQNSIGRAKLDGTEKNQSFITGAGFPTWVAVDGSHVYWSNEQNSTIGRANLDGTSPTQNFIETHATQQFGLAVDGMHIYWADREGGKIGRANLNGSAVEGSFITGASDPIGVAVDALPPPSGLSTSGVSPTPGGRSTEPSNVFTVLKRQLDRKAGTATLLVKLPGAGRLVLTGSGIQKVAKQTSAAAKLTLRVKPLAKTVGLLSATGSAAVKLKLTYTPTGGDPRTQNASLVLKLAGGS
jgi:virginiamycin B lyase